MASMKKKLLKAFGEDSAVFFTFDIVQQIAGISDGIFIPLSTFIFSKQDAVIISTKLRKEGK